jgi:IS5 family transposase
VRRRAAGQLTQDRLLRGRKLRVDTTVVEADIDHPTDADLLEKAVRKLGGLIRRVKARGAASRTRFRDRGRAAGRRLKQISRSLRRRTGQAQVEVDRLTAQVAGIARRALGQAERVVANTRRARGQQPSDGQLRRLLERLEETTTLTRRLLDQTSQRLAGQRVIGDRLVSLADPDARPIRKGKPGRATEFGYTVLLAEDERGFIAAHQTHKGNPADATLLVGAVHGVIAVTGRPPDTVVGDRGFGSAAKTTRWQPLASSGSGCSAPAHPARPAAPGSRPDGSGACATGASGSKPASASSSAPSGCAAHACVGWAAPAPGWAWGSSPTTCSGWPS